MYLQGCIFDMYMNVQALSFIFFNIKSTLNYIHQILYSENLKVKFPLITTLQIRNCLFITSEDRYIDISIHLWILKFIIMIEYILNRLFFVQSWYMCF